MQEISGCSPFLEMLHERKFVITFCKSFCTSSLHEITQGNGEIVFPRLSARAIILKSFWRGAIIWKFMKNKLKFSRKLSFAATSKRCLVIPPIRSLHLHIQIHYQRSLGPTWWATQSSKGRSYLREGANSVRGSEKYYNEKVLSLSRSQYCHFMLLWQPSDTNRK